MNQTVNSNRDSKSKKGLAKMRREVEKAKRSLSTTGWSSVLLLKATVHSRYNGIPFWEFFVCVFKFQFYRISIFVQN